MVLFLKVFLTEFIAEMGDKTQLMLIALTSKYKLKDIILGTAAAILVLNGMAVLAGGLVSEFIPDWLIKTIAALAFLYFAASTISGDDDEEEEEGGKSKIRFAPLAVFCTFFVAELGDKTQHSENIRCEQSERTSDPYNECGSHPFICTKGDCGKLCFVIFSIFGVYTLYQGLKLISASVCPLPVWPVLIAATAVFVVACVCLFVKREKKKAK